MKKAKIVLFLLTIMCSAYLIYGQEAVQINHSGIRGDKQFGNYCSYGNSFGNHFFSVNCAPDTVMYNLSKATGYQVIMLHTTSSISKAAQYYECPQSLSLTGFSFYAYKTDLTGGSSTNLTCQLFLAGSDSLPTGAALATTILNVDTNFYGGSLSQLRKSVTFPSPVSVTQPYVMVVSNPSTRTVGIVSNNYSAGPPDGKNEWLANAEYLGTWFRSYGITVGGTPFNADFLIEPLVTYSLNADFNISPACVTVAATVGFTNNSSPVLASRMYNMSALNNQSRNSCTWNFGDGTGDMRATDTTHFYSGPGTYQVTLKDSLFGWTRMCIETTSRMIYGGPPVPVFTQNATGLQASFNFPGIDATSWTWDFGDGTTGTGQSTPHIYANPGTYSVCLAVQNNCGTSNNCQNITVSCVVPVSAYTLNQSGYATQFTSNTTGATSWLWTFGDGSADTVSNPSHLYASQGTYSVCLIASSVCGSDTFCQNVNVTCPAPVANYTYTDNLLAFSFTDLSVGTAISTWVWDFGDGVISNLQNPNHTYAVPGNYTVCLTMTDLCGYHSTCQQVNATCPIPQPSFTFTPSMLTVDFFDNTIGNGLTNWDWDFGDGNTSTLQFPSHTFAAPGVYSICLTVTNSCGNSTQCTPVSVSIINIDQEIGQQIRVFPTPADDRFWVETGDGPATLILSEITGREIMKISGKLSRYEIPVSTLSPGMYYLSVKTTAGTVTKRVQVMR